MEAAPYFDDVADGPDGGSAHWVKTDDGLKIRVRHWPLAGAKGTILLFPGRTEYIEKYGRAAGEFQARGYAVAAVDWRGQGLAERMNEDRGLGHVDAFTDFQFDVNAMLAHVRALDLPQPYYLVAHSMGGCIGLRSLYEGLPVNAVAFSAPMWGIMMTSVMRPAAWVLSSLARRLGMDKRVAPGQDTANYLEKVLLAENALTTDPEMFAYMQRQLEKHPDLGLGGPSLRWLNEALSEMRGLSARLSPTLPCITFLGTDESIVDPDAIRSRMGAWADGTLDVIDTARHEVMMETPDMRARVFDRTTALFDAHP